MRRARLGFEEGQIPNAWLREAPGLTDLLVLAGLVSPTDLAEVATRAGERQAPIGNLLVERGRVSITEIGSTR